MEAKIKEGMLVISLPLETPRPSETGKTLLVATSGGRWQSAITVNGKPVWIIVNAYIHRELSSEVKVGTEPAVKAARTKGRRGRGDA